MIRERPWWDTPEILDPIVEGTYRIRLADDAGGLDAEWRAKAGDRMVEKDGDDGTKLRGRAAAYKMIVRAVLLAIDWEDPRR
jgi:hypothetical protein